ncbi:MAG: toxin-activating lysine-acyltransferase [Aphanocapsa sp. GSE-SYN-MK-11-07L]|jgi:cytolysin-activating lysine-acyltransferase|nr:toxin-activating lysine-acyltransferase [Aphanocapsa sp. GSE-SYN-MK-11-07L]
MIASFYQVYQRADPSQDSTYCQIGYAMLLLAQSPSGATRPISYLQTMLSPAILTEQICFLFDEEGKPVSYLIWAYLAPDVERRILTSFSLELHESEWNEGSSLWIVDLVAPYGHLKHVLRFVRDQLFLNEPRVRYLRTNQRNRRVVEHSRTRLAGCLRSMPPLSPYCRCGRLDCEYYQ